MVTTRTLAVSLAAIALLGAVSVPAFAYHGPQMFSVMAAPAQAQPGSPVLMLVSLKHASPSCAYSVEVSVTGPGGVSAQNSTIVNTNPAGNGAGSVLFPDAFTGTGSTAAQGTYQVTASFQCQYTYVAGAASTSFVVRTSNGRH